MTLLLAAPLAAQDVEGMGRRVDSTLRAAAILRDSLASYRRSNPVRMDFDDSVAIGAGRVTVYFNAEFARFARPGIAEAERYLQELGGALNLLPPMVFSIVPDTAASSYDERLGRVGALNVRRHFADAPNSPNKTSVESDPKSIASVLVSAVSSSFNGKTAMQTRGWTSAVLPVATDLAPAPDWGQLRLALVSSPSYLGRACFERDVKACRLFLGIDSTADPVRELLNPAGRRMVVDFEIERSRRASPAATDRCLAGSDDACIAVLQISGMAPFASPFVRLSLITHALGVGGSHSAERLVMTTGTVGEVLAATANEPLDSLVADWSRHLSDRAGTAGHVPPMLVIASLGWVAVCFFLALRSSRWR
jgi:hypothetical protein